jgi:hypothetical protein
MEAVFVERRLPVLDRLSQSEKEGFQKIAGSVHRTSMNGWPEQILTGER